MDIPEDHTVEDYKEYDDYEEEFKKENTSDKDDVQMDEADIYTLVILDTDPKKFYTFQSNVWIPFTQSFTLSYFEFFIGGVCYTPPRVTVLLKKPRVW